MKKQVIKSIKILGLLFFLTVSLNLKAQQKLQLQTDAQEFVVKGTSTLHDWHMASSEAEGFIQLDIANNGVPSFTSSEITLLAESLKSGKKGMDKNAYKALETDDHPTIQFTLNKCSMESATSGKAWGKLSIAGTTRDVTFEIEVQQAGGTYTIKGTTDFRLTDFQIDPPTALMGTIKTGDEVTIEFKTTFQN